MPFPFRPSLDADDDDDDEEDEDDEDDVDFTIGLADIDDEDEDDDDLGNSIGGCASDPRTLLFVKTFFIRFVTILESALSKEWPTMGHVLLRFPP